MKSRLMATSLALALFTFPVATVHAQQNELVVAQAEDAELLAKFNELTADTRPASELKDKELAARSKLARTLLADKTLGKPQQQQVRKIAKEARDESVKRRKTKQEAAKQEKKAAEGDAAAQAPAAETVKKVEEPKAVEQKVEEPAVPKVAEGAVAESDAGVEASQANVAPDPKLEVEAQKLLGQTAAVEKLTEEELRRYIRDGRRLLQNPALPKSVTSQLRQRQQAMRVALQGGGAAVQAQQPASQQPANPAADESAAQKILGDVRPATTLSQSDLESRLNSTRKLLSGTDLPGSTVKQLRVKLGQDRTEFRRRRAAEQVKEDAGKGQANDKDKVVQLESDDYYLKDRRRAAALNKNELERRVLVMRIAFVDTRYPRVDRERWREQIETDRAELRRRALDDRRRREAEWRKRRDNGNLDIVLNINIGLGDGDDGRGRPRPIYLAEADDEDVERYLVAAPVRPPARRYTMEEVRTMPEVRQSMPAVEIDTIKFGFNEDFVREEALEELDRVGEAIERVLTAHPGEVFLVEGHTDAVGSDGYNLDLSKRRAESVKQALTTYYNIDSRNIATAGYGEEFLRVQTPDEEPENRRVTIRRATPLVGELN